MQDPRLQRSEKEAIYRADEVLKQWIIGDGYNHLDDENKCRFWEALLESQVWQEDEEFNEFYKKEKHNLET